MKLIIRSKKYLFLFILFMTISFNIGWSGFVRYDTTNMHSNGDIRQYLFMAQDMDAEAPFRYRVIIPFIAKSIYTTIKDIPMGHWNPLGLSFWIVNSIFVSLCAMLIYIISSQIGFRHSVSILSSLLYLSSFPVINFHVLPHIDSLEVLLLLFSIYMVQLNKFFILPFVAFISGFAKETTFVFICSYFLGYIVIQYCYDKIEDKKALLTVLLSVVLGIISTILVRSTVGGEVYGNYTRSFFEQMKLAFDLLLPSTFSRTFLYTFPALIIFSIPSIKKIPQNILFPSIGMVFLAYVMSIYGVVGHNIFRPIFNVSGWLLCIMSAYTLVESKSFFKSS